MRIKNRLSPYPILDDYGDDYINSYFNVEYNIEIQFTELIGSLHFNLKNNEIERLIDLKKAEFLVHIECPSTCYRKVFSSTNNEIDFKIDSSLLSKQIEIRTFIVMKESVKDFYSDSFHSDYNNQKFNLEPHQIIGIGTAKDFDIQKDENDLDSLPSIIRIVKLENKKKGTLSVNTDNDSHIIIGLSKDVFDLYANLGKSTFKTSVFSLVLLPALIIVLQRMYNNRDDESVNSMHWYKVIENMLENNGFYVDKLSIDNDSLFSVCQSIFADPIARSFKELNQISERL